jgi:hypothetical protein
MHVNFLGSDLSIGVDFLMCLVNYYVHLSYSTTIQPLWDKPLVRFQFPSQVPCSKVKRSSANILCEHAHCRFHASMHPTQTKATSLRIPPLTSTTLTLIQVHSIIILVI